MMLRRLLLHFKRLKATLRIMIFSIQKDINNNNVIGKSGE